jgi:hypothetical protein
MRVILLPAFLLMSFAGTASAQWDIQNSGTKASLRGIHSVGKGVAWASGTGGTVLLTEDGGKVWRQCATPPDAEKLDFRGVQAFDAKTAIVMSSGKGDLSRLYKTTDGCATWRLLFANPDPDGFWDGVTARIDDAESAKGCSPEDHVVTGSIFGDPAIHRSNRWDTTKRPSFFLAPFEIHSSCAQDALAPSVSSLFSGVGEAAFAASNSVLIQLAPHAFWILSSREIIQYEAGASSPGGYGVQRLCAISIPIRHDTASQGAFSFSVRPGSIQQGNPVKIFKPFSCAKADLVAVGGDYTKPDSREGTAAFTGGSNKFQLAETSPAGYRSAVAYDAATRTWITVGPNGTDISTDDGRNWRALKPGPHDAPDADKNWNALSLPFVVGANGRIGVLREDALGTKDPSQSR